jgi:hypothetical protein
MFLRRLKRTVVTSVISLLPDEVSVPVTFCSCAREMRVLTWGELSRNVT